MKKEDVFSGIGRFFRKRKTDMLRLKTSLTPLAGFSDSSFRKVCKRFGADAVTTEMVSAKGLYYSDKKTAMLLAFDPSEQPVYIQIFGSDPEIMAFAAGEVTKLSPAGIDINMGCPMPKIVNNGDGCALMKDPKRAESVIKAVVAATPLPVSVKFRSGYDEAHINAVEFGVMCEEAGAKSLTVHARTRTQLYSGKADREIIRRVKETVSVPVFGNGDVFCPEDAEKMYEQTGVDGVAVGRGALGNPFIFSQIKSYFETGTYGEYDKRTRLTTALEQVRDMCRIKGEKVAVPEARKHLAFYLKGMRGAAKIKNAVFAAKSYEETEKILFDFIEEN